MTSSLTNRVRYFGYLLDEFIGEAPPKLNVQLAIYVPGWEQRSLSLAAASFVKADQNLVLRFSDEGLVEDIPRILQDQGQKAQEVPLPSHYEVHASVARALEAFQSECAMSRVDSVFLDITSLPKVIMQWLVLELLRSKTAPQVYLGYVAGLYHDPASPTVFDQGVRRFITVPLSVGDGGASVRKACIAALGADERLVGHYFENEAGFDRYSILASREELDPTVSSSVETQVSVISHRYDLRPEDVLRALPHSFLESLSVLDDAIRRSPSYDSWELFCTGPKPHAAAGCLLSLKHRNVRLVGRVPREYDRSNVSPTGVFSVLRIVDLTNPRVALLRNITPLLGSA